MGPPDDPSLYPRSRHAWYILCLLVIGYVFSFVDRQILSLLVAPVRHDLAITEVQLSLLQGLAFAILYTTLGLPLGLCADRINRRNIIIVGVVVWSVMTICCGLATNYKQLFVARVGVGIGEASLGPAAYSMVADLFPPARRGGAYGVYSAGVYLGLGASSLLGGIVLKSLGDASLVTLPIFGALHGWQATFIIVGAPGLLLALLLASIREPARKHEGAAPLDGRVTYASRDRDPFELFRFYAANRLIYVYQFLGTALLVTFAYGASAWLPTFFVRVHQWSAADTGIRLGIVTMLLGTGGAVMGGFASDRLIVRGVAAARLRISIWAIPLWLLAVVAATVVSNPWVGLASYGIASLLNGAVVSLAPTAILDVAPVMLRGQVTALYLFTINLLGLGAGPTLVAFMTEHVFQSDAAVGKSIVAVALPLLCTGWLFLYRAQPVYLAAQRALAR